MTPQSPLYRPSSAGGVNLVTGSHRITLNNTLDERLRLLEDRVSSICPYLT
jgi:vacuolar-type H+-ATPase subunit E/Vma4